MKKITQTIVILLLTIFIMESCKKKENNTDLGDTTKPVITLNGADTVYLFLNGTYSELGATAIDDVAGGITPVITGTVNTSIAGTYIIVYTATDPSNNVAVKQRYVIVGGTGADNTPPVITLNGADTVTISLQGSYTELGASAIDAVAGNIIPTMSGSVNTNLTGYYPITYSATDPSNNTAIKIRYVKVKNDADMYAGTYTCTNPNFGVASPWTQTVTTSTTINNRIKFSKFAARTGVNSVEAILTGGTAFVLIPSTVTGIGTNGCTYSYTANGFGININQTGGKYTFSIKYFEQGTPGGAGCPGFPATPFEDTFVQQ